MNKYTRRNFIKSVGMAAGGAALFSKLYADGQNIPKAASRNERINVALVGVGRCGEMELTKLLRIPGLNVQAVCDIMPFRLRYGAARITGATKSREIRDHAYEDYRELIAHEKNLDAVVIVTPDFWHARQTVDFLEAGVNVYCAGMMSNTMEGAQAMLDSAKKTGKLLQIGYSHRSNPASHFYKGTFLDSGFCGRLTGATGRHSISTRSSLYAGKTLSEKIIATLKKYGYESEEEYFYWSWNDKFSLLGSHTSGLAAQADMFSWFLNGRPLNVTASAMTSYYTDKKAFDTISAAYSYETFQGGQIQLSLSGMPESQSGCVPFQKILGDEYSFQMSLYDQYNLVFKERKINYEKWDEFAKKHNLHPAIVGDEANCRYDPFVYGFPKDKIYGMYAFDDFHMENFFNAIRGKEKLNCDAETAFASEMLLFKMKESIDSGKKLDL